MRLLLVLLVINFCYFNVLCLPRKLTQPSSCTLQCAKLPKSDQAGCNCPDVSSGIVKRDTVQELITKVNKRRRLPLKPLEPVKFELNKKLHLQPKSAINPIQHHSNAYKELQDRLKDFKTRMSAKSLLKSRANFHDDDKPNLMEKFKSKQEELMEKVRNANTKAQLKTNAVRENLQDQNDLKRENLLGATTETSPKSSTVLVLVTSSTTTSAPLINDVNSHDKPKTIDRIKEKQKEAVTKIKDKISLTKLGKSDA